MDLKTFKTSDWLMVGGGLGFLIFGTFFDWAKVDFGFGSASGGNAFDFFFRGTVPWILIVGAGVLAFLLAAGILKRGTTPWPLVLLGATGLGTLLNLIIVITGPSKDGADFDRAIGLYLAFVSAVVALVGAVMSFKESGGDLDDLRDVNKLKSAFGQGGSASTPPAAPPPPPAPPAAPNDPST